MSYHCLVFLFVGRAVLRIVVGCEQVLAIDEKSDIWQAENTGDGLLKWSVFTAFQGTELNIIIPNQHSLVTCLCFFFCYKTCINNDSPNILGLIDLG